MSATNWLQILNDRHAAKVLPNTVFHLVGATVGLIGNLVVLFVYALRIQDKTGSRYFIPVLAVVDVLGCIANATFFQLDNTIFYAFPGGGLCQILLFLIIWTGGFSAHLILAIALQRYFLICRPLGRQLTGKLRRLLILIIFLVSVMYAAPMFHTSGLIQHSFTFNNKSEKIQVCSFQGNANVSGNVVTIFFGFLLFMIVANIVVTSALYIPVAKTVYSSFSRRKQRNVIQQNMNNKDSNSTQICTIENIAVKCKDEEKINSDDSYTQIQKREITADVEWEDSKMQIADNEEMKSADDCNTRIQKQQKTKTRITKMFLLIIIAYIVSYIPSVTLQICVFLFPNTSFPGISKNIFLFFFRFNMLNHIVNPYIYWFYDMKFRNQTKALWSKCMKCK